jgi:branched-chain amino acid transport system ATP-binding protein
MLRFYRGSIRAGEVRLGGARLDRLPSYRIVDLGVAQIPEGRLLFANLTVEENLLTGASRRSREEIAESLERVYALFPVLADRRRNQAGWMSGGEQQMIAIGRALMADPKVLLVDELSLGLAPRITETIAELLRQASDELGLTLLVVEQNSELALDLCDYGYILESGRIALEGPTEALRRDEQVRDVYLAVGGSRSETGPYVPTRKWWL